MVTGARRLLIRMRRCVCGLFGHQDSIWIPLARSRWSGTLGVQNGSFQLQRTWRIPTKMKIHEYQAKEILAQYGVAVATGEMANTLGEATAVARKLLAAGATGVSV